MYTQATDQLLTAIFLVLAVVSLVLFFAVENRLWFLIVCGIAILLRVVQYILRAVTKRRQVRRVRQENFDFDNDLEKE